MELPTFEAGRPLREQVTADALNAMCDGIRSLQVSSAHILVSRGSGGTLLSLLPGDGGGGDSQRPAYREFDISVLSDDDLTVKVRDGTWMGIRQTGATEDGTRNAYHTLTVAHDDKIYLKLEYRDGGGALSKLTIEAGAVPSNVANLGLWYTELATVTVANGIISISQKRWGPLEYTKETYRELHIEPCGEFTVRVYSGTIFGELPSGFFVNDDPFFELSSLADGDIIYAEITWDHRVKADGDIGGTITDRFIDHAATLPTDDPLTGKRYYQLAVVGLDADDIPIVDQSRWGPINDLPGTAANPYLMPPSPGTQSTAQADYWNLTETGKGKDTGAANLAQTYDSVQMNKTGFVRFVNDDGNLKAFIRPPIINSIGQVTYAGPEELAFEHVQIDVLVDLRLSGGQLQGKYKKVWVMTSEASSPEWRNLIATTASVPDNGC